MEAKLAQFGNKGMYKDTSISKSSNEYAYENKNVRITVGDEESLLSVTNEKLPSVQKVIIKKELTKNVVRIVPKGPSGRGKPVDPTEHLRVRIASQYESRSNVPMIVECSFGRINGVLVWDENEQEEIEYKVSLFGQYEESHVYIWGIKSNYGGETLYVLKAENDPNLKQTDTIYKKVSAEDQPDLHYENDYYKRDEDHEFPQKPFIYEFAGKVYRSNIELDKDGFTQIVQNVSKTYPINTSETIILKEELAQDISYNPGSDYEYVDDDSGYFDLSATGLTVDYTDAVFHYVDENNDTEEDQEFTEINGTYIGHCLTSDYLVLFVKAIEDEEQVDYIYRLEKATDGEHDFLAQQLFKGHLEFSEDNPIETLFYYESEDVQKVYWIDGKHQTRVINIKKNDYVTDLNTQFDFVPSVSGTPTVKISKNFDATGNFHSGVIQYFITYYNKFGAETGIVWSSVLHYIAPEDRGGAPDEFVSCSFELELKDLDQNFEYARVYSLKRQSLDGPTELNVVKDFRIKNKSSVKIIDTGANQETLDSNYIYYIGGSNFVAETFAQKDDTLFLGNIEIKDEELDGNIKDHIKQYWIGSATDPEVGRTKNDAKKIYFDYKCFAEEPANTFYPYNQQINLSSLAFKGFKYGEIYRFAIQYKTKYGKWTEPVWIGDKKCDIFPKRLQDGDQVAVPTAKFELDPLDSHDEEYLQLVSDFLGYRILMAKTDFTTRNVVAQGIICPTMFNYDQRIKGKPYSIASYIMRPRWGNAEHRHFYPVDEIFSTQKLMLPENINDLSPQGAGTLHVVARVKVVNEFKIPVWWGYKSSINFYVYRDNGGTQTEWKRVTHAEGSSNYACNKAYVKIGNLLKKLGGRYASGFLSREDHDKMHLTNDTITGWTRTTWEDLGNIKVFERDETPGESDPIYLEYLNLQNEDSKESASFNNEFYVDESIVTFNSPDLETNLNQIDNSNLNFRIVGIAPITANKSDFDLKFIDASHTLNGGSLLSVPDTYNLSNISEHAITLLREYLYSGPTFSSGSISSVDKYDISMWHHSGSISNVYITSGGQKVYIDQIESNKFSTERFSICTEYFTPKTYRTSSINVFNYDGISMCRIPIVSGTGVYYGNYNNVITPTGEIDITRENFDTSGDQLKTSEPTQISYKSTPHAVFSLIGTNQGEDESLENVFHLLPRISSDLTKPQEELEDYTQYSFIWNDAENIAPRDPMDDANKIYCMGIMYVPPGITDESRIIGQMAVYCYDHSLSYVPGKTNCVLVSRSDRWEVNPVIDLYYSHEVTKHGMDITIGNKVDITNNPIIILSDTGDYYMPKKKVVNGSEVYIYYEIDDNTKKLQDSTPYEALKYVRCETIDYSCKYPYLFIGELYRNLPYDTLYGGYDENAIENITWIPASGEVHINDNISKMEGDTFFQRWDCVKTTPMSNGGINSILDITSVMLESHICLDGRFDRNRGGDNILDINEDNFNLLNDVYGQSNNVFQYNILDDKYDLDTFKNQVVWSNQKHPASDIDEWTNISQLSSMYLNGEYGPINKLVNYNDNILAFQDKAISAIKFNNNIQVSTEQGLPIEVVNSNKVTGYDVVSRVNGCHNKWSIHQTSGGLYFIDDYNKALFRFNKDGLSNISLSAGFSKWFKDNITGEVWKPGSKKEFRISSDQITHDVYIIRNSTSSSDLACLAYNEDTQTFTSFYPIYRNSVSMFNLTGDSFYLGKDLNVYKMFDGDYCRDFYVEYNINPEPLENKIFTNIEYVADTIKLSGLNAGLQKVNPFAELYVETEYQSGLTNLLRQTYPNGLAKFRVWRADIPRGSGWSTGNKLNRIQNPWIKLRLTGTSEDYLEGITTLHSLTVKYFK